MKLHTSCLAIVILGFAVLPSCKKTNYETKPKLEISSYNRKKVSAGQNLSITLRFYDKEGDLYSGEFYAKRVRLNRIISAIQKESKFTNTLADFPPKNTGEIVFTLDYSRLEENLVENDTLQFQFSVRDAAQNQSDTITSETIVIVK